MTEAKQKSWAELGNALDCALDAFEEELAKHQIEMPYEFEKLVEEHFWEWCGVKE